MSTAEGYSATLTTAWCSLIAEGLLVLILAAGTSLGDWFQARRTASKMARQGTLMATLQHLQARTAASWRNLAASYGWFDLGYAARAVEWLSRVDFAGLAFAEMAEVIARVFPACQGFAAKSQADVASLWIGSSFPHWTADFLALVASARFGLVAYSSARPFASSLKLLWAQEFLFQLFRVVHSGASNDSFVFSALTGLRGISLAKLAAVCVTSLLALMPSAWQELLALVRASWDWIRASSPLSSDERLDGVVTTRAEPETFRVSWTRRTGTFVASPLALMLTTIKLFPADFVALLSLASTRCSLFLFTTEAWLGLLNRARIARTLVAFAVTFVSEAAEKFPALVLTRKLRSRCELAGDSLLFLTAVTRYWDADSTRRTATRVAKCIAAAMGATFVLLALTVLSTGVGKCHWVVGWLFIPTTETLVSG